MALKNFKRIRKNLPRSIYRSNPKQLFFDVAKKMLSAISDIAKKADKNKNIRLEPLFFLKFLAKFLIHLICVKFSAANF